MMGKLILKRASSGMFYFVLKADNGEVLLRSVLYRDKSETLNGIASLRSIVIDDEKFQTNRESNAYVFTLTDCNGAGIGTGEPHVTLQSLERAKKAIKENALGSVIIDQT